MPDSFLTYSCLREAPARGSCSVEVSSDVVSSQNGLEGRSNYRLEPVLGICKEVEGNAGHGWLKAVPLFCTFCTTLL